MDYNNEDVLLNNEATDRIIKGINKLCDAVKVTMGPSGRTVIITDERGMPYATKDGVSVAKELELQDPVENMGCLMAKEVAKKTAEEAGDGTTTASVLIQAFIKEGVNFINNGGSYNTVKKVYASLLPEILKSLKNKSTKLNKKNIIDVATISANNDDEIGTLISKAFRFSKIVQVEEGREIEDEIIKIDGVRYPVSYMSKSFITNDIKQIAKIENPAVLLLDCKLDSMESIVNVAKHCNNTEKSLLIISEHINDNVLDLLEQNHENGALKILPIKTPGFGKYRKEYIKDISLFSGATIVKNLKEPIEIDSLGSIEVAEASLHETILLPSKNVNLITHIKNLSEYYNDSDLPDYDKKILGERINNLNAKVSIIKVGGRSDIERKERFDRIEDAVYAVSSGLDEGVVHGGGLTLNNISNEFKNSPENNIILNALKAPLKTMNENGASIDNTLDKRIVDPVKVTRCALENAASIALTILGTKAIVINKRLWI